MKRLNVEIPNIIDKTLNNTNNTITTFLTCLDIAFLNPTTNKIIPDSKQNTIVDITKLYTFTESKHSLENYNQWMSNMLENISTPMMIYCDSECEDFIRKKRKKFLDNTKIEVITLMIFIQINIKKFL